MFCAWFFLLTGLHRKWPWGALCCEIMYMVRSPDLIGRHGFRRCDKNMTALIDMASQPIRSVDGKNKWGGGRGELVNTIEIKVQTWFDDTSQRKCTFITAVCRIFVCCSFSTDKPACDIFSTCPLLHVHGSFNARGVLWPPWGSLRV